MRGPDISTYMQLLENVNTGKTSEVTKKSKDNRNMHLGTKTSNIYREYINACMRGFMYTTPLSSNTLSIVHFRHLPHIAQTQIYTQSDVSLCKPSSQRRALHTILNELIHDFL